MTDKAKRATTLGSTGTTTPRKSGRYALATGEAAAHRLAILHQAYGPGSQAALRSGGIRPGMRVADLGCGVGQVTAELAELVGENGHVVGVDLSPEQLREGDRHCQTRGLTNVTWVAASAVATGLPTASFDLVYCRFLLLHLQDPDAALREMHRILRPGGLLVVEDGDLLSAGSQPPTVLNLFAELWGKLAPKRKVDYSVANRLPMMVRGAGFGQISVTFNQPAFVRGDAKRLLELSVAEAGPAFIEEGLISENDLRHGVQKMKKLAGDETVLAILPRMAQVTAIKLAA